MDYAYDIVGVDYSFGMEIFKKGSYLKGTHLNKHKHTHKFTSLNKHKLLRKNSKKNM